MGSHQSMRHHTGRFPCDHPYCQHRYNGRGAALACCGDRPLPTPGRMGYQTDCPDCAATVSMGARYCSGCGRQLREPVVADGGQRVAVYECACGSQVTIPERHWQALQYLASKFGHQSIDAFVTANRDCCRRPTYDSVGDFQGGDHRGSL